MSRAAINDIRDAISLALSAEWPDKDIYTEQVEQELLENGSCFTITCIDSSIEHEINIRYKRAHHFAIHYFTTPDGSTQREECHEVQERLYDILEYIECDGAPIRGTRMNGHIERGVLTFTVSYDLAVYREADKPIMMEDLEQNTGANA